MVAIAGLVTREKTVRLPVWMLGSVRTMTGRSGLPEGATACLSGSGAKLREVGSTVGCPVIKRP